MIRPAISPPEKPGNTPQNTHWFFSVLFLLFFALGCLQMVFGFSLPISQGWLDAGLVLSAAAATFFALARQLPMQNVLLATMVIGLISGVVHFIGAESGIPFGPMLYTENAGPKIFHLLPWAVPVIWIVVIFNSRGVARLILRPWRKSRIYGFRLIGGTAVLAVLLDFALEPFASRIRGCWLWDSTKLGLSWAGTPPTNFLGWLVTAVLILAFVTPSLINKSHQKFPPDYHPLVVWILLALLFATGEMKHQLWLPAALAIGSCVLVAASAIRGARW